MTYTRDHLNRLTGLQSGGMTSGYTYRADGLRVQKASHAGSTLSYLTSYRYDGQMGIEDVDWTSTNGGLSYSITAITRNALGARGVDAISRTTSTGTAVAYPLYDAHGNNVGMLSKSGASWSVGDERSYDAWGQVRSGAIAGDQKGRYCASIGHKQDDESGLIYMRARYYDPTNGRFISEDPANDGCNWYIYCRNKPVQCTDSKGLFLDLLIGSFIDMLEQTKNAAYQRVAQDYARNKIEDIMAKRLGQLLGTMLEMELGDAWISPNGYLMCCLGPDGKGPRIGIDFSESGIGRHGRPHIDLFDGLAQKLGGKRVELFIDGLLDGLFGPLS